MTASIHPSHMPPAARTSLRVLIVDDSEADTTLMMRALEVGGFDVKARRIESSGEMDDALRSDAWDIVLCDYRMPSFSGRAALAQVRHFGCDLPVLMITGSISEESAVELLKSGAADVVMKDNLSRLAPAASRALMEAAGRRQLRLQSAALNAAANAITITDARGVIVWVNPAFTKLTGYAAREVVGLNPRLLKSGKHKAGFYDDLWRTILAGNVWRGELINRRKDGSSYCEEMAITPVRDERGHITHFIGIKQDISERRKTEDDLRESEHKYRELFESLTDAAFLASADSGIVSDCNREAEVLLGRPRSKIIGTSFETLHPPEHIGYYRRIFAESASRAHSRDLEAEVVTSSGAVVPVTISATRLSLPGREVMLALFRNTTERKLAERQVADALSLKQAILAASPAGALAYASDGRCVLANAAAARLIGGSIEELKAQNARELISWKQCGFADAFERTLRTGQEQHVEAHFVTTFGKEAWLSSRFAPFVYDGEPHVLVLVADIADTKRAEEEMRAVNERYVRQEKALIELTRQSAAGGIDAKVNLGRIAELTAQTLGVERVSVWEYDHGKGLLTCRSLYELSKRQSSEGGVLSARDFPAYFRAMCSEDVIAAPDAHRDARTAELSEMYLKPLGIGAMMDCPIHMQGHTAGVLCCEDVGGTRLWTADEQTFGVAVANLIALLFAHEARQRLEAQFLRAQRMESIGTLASGVAHDLNNILAPIMISVQLLREQLSPEQLESVVETIATSAERGAQVVKQVLAFGRGLGGEKHPLQVAVLVKEMTKIMAETFPKEVQIECWPAATLWPVVGDATQLHQVLLNLCVNARDAMAEGGRLHIEAANTELDESSALLIGGGKPGCYVQLKVSDTGSGIPADVLEHIFDPFFTTKGVGKGTGLGLSTVHGIVKDHGGFIDVNTTVGKGTTFAIYLPAIPEGDVQGGADGAEAKPHGDGELVLVVDDERVMGNAVRRALESHGYRVLMAADGVEGIATYARSMDQIALVVTDVMMPLLDGTALIRTIRKMRSDIPVIAMTGLGESGRIADLRALGVHALLEKPFRAPELLRAVHEALHGAA